MEYEATDTNSMALCFVLADSYFHSQHEQVWARQGQGTRVCFASPASKASIVRRTKEVILRTSWTV